jgi:phage tail-like protein
MRGLISEARTGGPGVAAPMALRRAVPAVYHEDPLFAELCHAFDELISPLVSAVDCFAAYLDPRLAPDDFLPWLADLVGCPEPPPDPDAARELIAGAVDGHGVRGTPGAVRTAAARAAGVPPEHVAVDDPGGTRWSTVAFAAHDWPGGEARVRVLIPQGPDPQDVAADVRAALQAEAGVHCRLDVEVSVAPDPPAPEPVTHHPATHHSEAPDGPAPAAPPPAHPAPEQPPGPRMYGGQP